MALRGRKPQERTPRLKAMMYGTAGVGKTMAAIQMPRPYVIDTEGGTEHYGEIIERSRGVVFPTNSIIEVIDEVKTLMVERHDFLTLVIDPFTTLYETILEQGASEVGTDFGRHYGFAASHCKRLFNMLAHVDMNVIVTCHAKNEYGDGMKVIGRTFDGWRKLDYLFDAVFEIIRPHDKGARRAIVRKTRLGQFADMENFEWSYDALVSRMGRDVLERTASQITFATPEQIDGMRQLLEAVKVDEGWLGRCLSKANAARIEDLTTTQADKLLTTLKAKLPSAA